MFKKVLLKKNYWNVVLKPFFSKFQEIPLAKMPLFIDHENNYFP